MLLSVGDMDKALRIDHADVTGVQPSLFVDCLPGCFLVVPVSLHDIRAAGQDFAVVREFTSTSGIGCPTVPNL